MAHIHSLAGGVAVSRPALSETAERALFASLRLPGGIFKTTSARRLPDVDRAIAAALPPGLPVTVLDAGASSGTTTLELVEALENAGHRTAMTLTDISLTARLVRLSPRYAVLLGGDGALLQHLVGNRAVRPWRRRLDYATQFWVVTGAANRWFARARARGDIERAHSQIIRLVTPQVAAHPGITCEEGDIFAATPPHHMGAFDVVRAANVLLPDVFGEARVTAGLERLTERLRGPGALLVLARSPAPGSRGANRATIFRMGGDGQLAVLRRIGAGSEIEALVPDQCRTDQRRTYQRRT